MNSLNTRNCATINRLKLIIYYSRIMISPVLPFRTLAVGLCTTTVVTGWPAFLMFSMFSFPKFRCVCPIRNYLVKNHIQSRGKHPPPTSPPPPPPTPNLIVTFCYLETPLYSYCTRVVWNLKSGMRMMKMQSYDIPVLVKRGSG